METFLLIEIYAISLLILVGIVYSRKYSIDLQINNIVFSSLLYAVIAVISMNSIDLILLAFAKKTSIFISSISVAINYCLEEISCYLWFLYILCDGCGAVKKIFQKKNYLYISIPAITGSILFLLSPFFNIMFTVDSNLFSIQREKCFIIHLIIVYGYFSIAAIYKQIMLLKERKNHSGAFNILVEQIFILLPLISGVLYLLLPKIPTLWPFVTLTLLMVHISNQSRQISTDALTKLNNRRHFDQYLFASLSEERQEGQLLFFYMLDIDFFKSINDNFGHLEGDCALVTTAKILRSVCSDRSVNTFLARTGGDEFVIILKTNDEVEAEVLKQKIQNAFASWNKAEKRPYQINISIGYADAPYGMQPAELIKRADKKLYEEKKLHHTKKV